MNETESAAARRAKTIAVLTESMRTAQQQNQQQNQQQARRGCRRDQICTMVRVAPRIGIWKGGCA